MELQLALDFLQTEEALEMARQVEQYIDIIEIGTPFILAEGMRAVRCFREATASVRQVALLILFREGSFFSSVWGIDAASASAIALISASCEGFKLDFKLKVVSRKVIF